MESVINLLSRIDLNIEQKVRLEKELEDCDTSEEVTKEVDDIDDNAKAAEANEEEDLEAEIKEEDVGNDDNNMIPYLTCTPCRTKFKNIVWIFTSTNLKLRPEKFYGFSCKNIDAKAEVPETGDSEEDHNDEANKTRYIM